MSDGMATHRRDGFRPNADDVGAQTAMRRAALKAQREAIRDVGCFPIWRDGKVVYVTEVQFTEEDISCAEEQERALWGLTAKPEPAATSD